jgi:hypothetical protein
MMLPLVSSVPSGLRRRSEYAVMALGADAEMVRSAVAGVVVSRRRILDVSVGCEPDQRSTRVYVNS